MASGLIRFWLVSCGAFEIIALVRLFALKQPLSEVTPLHAGDKGNADLALYWAFVATLLALVRFGQAASPDSVALWRVTAAVHTLEVFVYGWWVFLHDRSVPTDLAKLDFSKHGQTAVIYAIVIFNAIVFISAWARSGTIKIKVN